MIDHLRDGFGVNPVWRMLQLSPSTYFARKQRPKSARRLCEDELIPLVTAVWEGSGPIYGAHRVARALVRAGHQVARCTVERLMREGVIRGQRRRTTTPEPTAPRPPDLVRRRFTAERPNQLWLANLTYIRTGSGLRRLRPGRVLASDRGLAGRHPHAHRPAAGRAGDGTAAAEDQEGRQPHSSFRPRVAIRVHSLHRAADGGRRLGIGRPGRRLVR
ncbi:IS3 family transposase [Streptomyces sp. SHP 1-2]|nr:IS3 family transposase [Streptomyces sp. SHP 1-2]